MYYVEYQTKAGYYKAVTQEDQEGNKQTLFWHTQKEAQRAADYVIQLGFKVCVKLRQNEPKESE